MIDIPGGGVVQIDHLVLDLNGTLTDRGRLIDGVPERISALASAMTIHVLTADTFGTAAAIGQRLGADVTPIQTGHDKAAFIRQIGPDATAAIGNGRNDAPMLATARLGIVVMAREGASVAALSAADIVVGSILDALDLLTDERALIATLRP